MQGMLSIDRPARLTPVQKEAYVALLGVVGTEQMREKLVRPDGSLGLPINELERELLELGYYREWKGVQLIVENEFGMLPTNDDELDEVAARRNQLFLQVVEGDLNIDALLAARDLHLPSVRQIDPAMILGTRLNPAA